MTFTAEQIAALKAAIDNDQLCVRIGDTQIRFKNLEEAKAIYQVAIFFLAHPEKTARELRREEVDRWWRERPLPALNPLTDCAHGLHC